MNNEIQIISTPASSLPAEILHPAGGWHGQSTAFSKMHRLLRGRYLVAIPLAVAFGLCGAFAGWRSRRPLYPSTAVVQVKSTVPDSERLARPDVELPGYAAIIRAQILALSSPDVIRSALQRPSWQAIRPGGEDQIVVFSNNLEVEQDPGSDLIKVTYSDIDPKAAKAGTNSLCEAYLDWYQSHDPSGNSNKKRLLEDERKGLSEQLARLRFQLDQLAEPFGGTYELTTYLQGQFQELNKRQADADDAKLTADRIEASLNTLAAGKAAAGAKTAGEIAQTDANMRDMLVKRQTIMEEAHRLEQNYGPKSPAVLKANEDLDLLNFEIDRYVKDSNQAPRVAGPAGNAIDYPISAGGLSQARADHERLVAMVNEQHDLIKKTGALVQQVQQLKDQITQTQAGLDVKVNALNNLEGQMDLESDQVRVLDAGDLPAEPNSDRRWIMAGVGFVGGASLPIMALLLIGIVDRRFRYSDETDATITGIPLLGILPTLPDMTGDPQQTAIAAHCVHQVRTLLQINGPDRRVYTITSASSGDGKTSLTLSLGLSFAASGSRTLLIDADMVGGGLTARLGVRSEQGLLEAIAAGNLAPFVHETDAANLAILPVGSALRRYAGTIAPAAVRRLVALAREQYEIVLIDTGPILGSIEASSVSAAADAVILCVARGQQRPLSDRALAHLQAVGARLAGMVFNRAEAHDFERSVSRTVIHSLPVQGSYPVRTNGQRMGPMAKAVASSVRPESEQTQE